MSSKFVKTGRFEEQRWTSDGNWVNVGGDRNWRNNNPGNIESGRFAERHGSIGSDGRFAIFPDYTTGKQALISLFKTTAYLKLSLAEAVQRFAPSVENDTSAYGAFVHRNTGIESDCLISELTEEQLNALAAVIEIFEGGHKGITHRIDDPDMPKEVAQLRRMIDAKMSQDIE